jgi:hypothetical protein
MRRSNLPHRKSAENRSHLLVKDKGSPQGMNREMRGGEQKRKGSVGIRKLMRGKELKE